MFTNRFASPFLVLCIVATTCVATTPVEARRFITQETPIPETAAGMRLSEMLDEMSAKGDLLETFVKEAFEKQSDEEYQRRKSISNALADQLGSLSFEKAPKSSEFEIEAVCKSSSGQKVKVVIQVAESSPHRITEIRIEGADSNEPESVDDSPLTVEEKKAVIATLTKELESKYVFPDVAKEMTAAIQKNLESGDYDEISEGDKLAQVLTEQLREICKDKHLRVMSGVPRSASSAPGRRRVDNHGFVKAEVLPGGIGYLKFNFFSGDPEAEKTAAAAMNFLSNCEAIIFDLRQNGGGSPGMIAFLSGYIFDESVHLNSFYNRPTDTTSESWSRDDVPGERFGETKPVYVLTSNYTFSGAEEFSYNLKNLKRGTIVGETTGGGAHPVMSVTLNDRLWMTMPFARAINPITNTNWEGVGVKPDVEVPADQALDAAIKLAEEATK